MIPSCAQIMVRLAVLAFLWPLAACSNDPHINQLPVEFMLESYAPSGAPTSTARVIAGDAPYVRLKALLDRHRSGWTRSYASYKTGPYVFWSASHIVRVFPTMIVIDEIVGGTSNSYEQKIDRVLEELGLS